MGGGQQSRRNLPTAVRCFGVRRRALAREGLQREAGRRGGAAARPCGGAARLLLVQGGRSGGDGKTPPFSRLLHHHARIPTFGGRQCRGRCAPSAASLSQGSRYGLALPASARSADGPAALRCSGFAIQSAPTQRSSARPPAPRLLTAVNAAPDVSSLDCPHRALVALGQLEAGPFACLERLRPFSGQLGRPHLHGRHQSRLLRQLYDHTGALSGCLSPRRSLSGTCYPVYHLHPFGAPHSPLPVFRSPATNSLTTRRMWSASKATSELARSMMRWPSSTTQLRTPTAPPCARPAARPIPASACFRRP